MKPALFFVAIMLLIARKSFCQRVTGTIKTSKDEGIPAAYIQVKKAPDFNIISAFYQTDDNGRFDFLVVPAEDGRVIIEIKAMGYAVCSDTVVFSNQKAFVNLQIVLLEEAYELEEVEIKYERKVVVKNDTTVFNAASFLTGIERKVEDLIKNLPGMEVSENGTVKYYGKIVESVQMNGDDLFGSNYSVGTRNLSVDLVEKVEAINNFIDNPILKNLVNSETVSLNLKLKKTNLKLMTDTNLGIGSKTLETLRHDAGITVLALSNRLKSFGTLISNNVGKSYGSSDYFYRPQDSEDEEAFLKPGQVERLIEEQRPMNLSGSNNEKINNEQTVGYNSLFKISDKISLKSNVNFLRDRLTNTQLFRQEFLTQNTTYDDKMIINNEHRSIQVESKLSYAINKQSLFINSLSLSTENGNAELNNLLNNSQNVKNRLITSNTLFRNNAEYSVRLSDSKALVFRSIIATNRLPQSLSFEPQVFENTIYQNASIGRFYVDMRSTFYQAIKTTKLSILAGHKYSRDSMNTTRWRSAENDFADNNNSILLTNFSYAKAIADTKLGKITSKTILETSYLDQRLSGKLESQQARSIQRLLFLPTVSLTYNPATFHKIEINIKQIYKPNYLENLYQNPVFQNNRLEKSNVTTLIPLRSREATASYRFQDLFILFTTHLGVRIRQNTNVLVNDITINENFTSVTSYRLPTSSDERSILLGVEKFVSALKLSVKFNSTIGRMNYFNSLGSIDQLRLNESRSQNHNLYVKTGFSFPVVFENTASISSNLFYTNGILQGKRLVSYSNTFKSTYKISQSWLLSGTVFTFIPNLQKKQSSMTIVDATTIYKFSSKSKLTEIRFTGNNLLNVTNYRTVQNSDFEITTFSSNLIGRYALISVGFRL